MIDSFLKSWNSELVMSDERFVIRWLIKNFVSRDSTLEEGLQMFGAMADASLNVGGGWARVMDYEYLKALVIEAMKLYLPTWQQVGTSAKANKPG